MAQVAIVPPVRSPEVQLTLSIAEAEVVYALVRAASKGDTDAGCIANGIRDQMFVYVEDEVEGFNGLKYEGVMPRGTMSFKPKATRRR